LAEKSGKFIITGPEVLNVKGKGTILIGSEAVKAPAEQSLAVGESTFRNCCIWFRHHLGANKTSLKH
jgi:hypothetical protein